MRVPRNKSQRYGCDKEGYRQYGRGAGQNVGGSAARKQGARATTADAERPAFRPLQKNDANQSDGEQQMYYENDRRHFSPKRNELRAGFSANGGEMQISTSRKRRL